MPTAGQQPSEDSLGLRQEEVQSCPPCIAPEWLPLLVSWAGSKSLGPLPGWRLCDQDCPESRSLRPMGHGLRLWAQRACMAWSSRQLRGVRFSALDASMPAPSEVQPGEEFQVLFEKQQDRLCWVASSMSWMAHPGWVEWLARPSLRAWWRRRMRHRHLEMLWQHCPQVWLVDKSPGNPHGELAGLGISSWAQWNELETSVASSLLMGHGADWQRIGPESNPGQTSRLPCWLAKRGSAAFLARYGWDDARRLTLQGLLQMEGI